MKITGIERFLPYSARPKYPGVPSRLRSPKIPVLNFVFSVYIAQTTFPFEDLFLLNGVAFFGTNFRIFRFVMVRFLSVSIVEQLFTTLPHLHFFYKNTVCETLMLTA